MTTDQERFDVLILRADTRQVSSVAAYALPLEAEGLRRSAGSVVVELLPGVRNGFELAIVPARAYAVGDVIPEEVPTQRRKRVNPPNNGYVSPSKRERAENCQCVRCGSPNLFTRNLCEPCTLKNNLACRKGRGTL
jgi:hypothetical protein